MGGGIIQLVAYGAQDIYLTGNPQITFFKSVYKRHTMFAIENFPQYASGTIDIGNKLTFTISRNGDLLSKSYIEFFIEFENNGTKLTTEEINRELYVNGPNTFLAKDFGYSLIEYIEIEINGTKIDKHTGHWMAINSELNKQFNKRIQDMFLHSLFSRAPHISENAVSICIPLQFWFCKNWGQSLPLIALQYHDVKIDVKISSINKLLLVPENDSIRNSSNNGLASAITDIKIIEMNLNCDYILLDTEERRKYAQNSHEYLIEQLQELPGEHCSGSNYEIMVPLSFNHPIKEIVWTLHDPLFQKGYGELWSGQSDRIDRAMIQLNGVDRFAEKPGSYFQVMQKYNHHDGIDLHRFITSFSLMSASGFEQFIDRDKYNSIPISSLDPFVYSFALSPGKHQPSGTCNFSRLDNAVLSMRLNKTIPGHISQEGINIKIYGIGYNILRIMNGMGGLAYSN